MKLLAISLSAYWCLGIASCSIKNLQPPPEHWLCQYNGTPRAFYCENSVTFQQIKVSADSSSVKGAQCLPADDYRAFQGWIDYLKNEAQQRCK